MARTQYHALLAGFTGKISNVLVKNYKDKIVLSAVPDMSKRVLSEKQKELNFLMSFANKYAKAITSDATLKGEACRVLMVPPNKVFRALVKEYIQRKGEVSDLVKPPHDKKE